MARARSEWPGHGRNGQGTVGTARARSERPGHGRNGQGTVGMASTQNRPSPSHTHTALDIFHV
eukprot:366054-Chlamydomonas_euryale.AAC.1